MSSRNIVFCGIMRELGAEKSVIRKKKKHLRVQTTRRKGSVGVLTSSFFLGMLLSSQ